MPPYTFYGLLCGTIPAYGMEKASGTPYVKVKLLDRLSETCPQHCTTVEDLVRYVEGGNRYSVLLLLW